MSDLLKKLAFTEVYILVSDNQVTLLIIFNSRIVILSQFLLKLN